MPIELRTGLPGHGKTLFAVYEIEKLRQKTGRPVYVSGIPDLQVPWIEIDDPTRWYEIEDGALIVIDEAQRVFRPRGTGAAVPPYVAAFETHRHRGHDVVLITQHPNLVDANIRRLVDRHVHMFRGMGLQSTTRYEWPECQNPNSRAARDNCPIKSSLSFPKEVFGLYRSASLHTVQARIPWKLVAFVGLCVLGIVAAGWRLTSSIGGRMTGEHAPAVAGPAAPAAAPGAPAGDKAGGGPSIPPGGYGAADLARLLTPVVPGIPASAPLYQSLWLRPVAAPIVSGCVRSADACQCYSQQGTRVDVSSAVCSTLVERPAFNHLRQDTVPASSSSPVQDAAPPAGSERQPARHERPRVNLS